MDQPENIHLDVPCQNPTHNQGMCNFCAQMTAFTLFFSLAWQLPEEDQRVVIHERFAAAWEQPVGQVFLRPRELWAPPGEALDGAFAPFWEMLDGYQTKVMWLLIARNKYLL